jgi:hypothetical protein
VCVGVSVAFVVAVSGFVTVAVSILPMTQFAVTKAMRSALGRRLSLDFMDPLFKRDVADKIDRLNENGTFPGTEHYVPVAAETVSFLEYLDPAEWIVHGKGEG